MKKVISGKLLKEKMQESIDLLCDTVKTTLGPQGNNVIIDNSSFSPFITNDGATIARNIESEDEIINTILEIAKEASLKTDSNVGDGTTTTLVLLESIFNSSLKYLESGINPIILKNELNNKLNYIISELIKLKLPASKKNLERIAKIAASDKELGKFINKVFQRVNNKNAITIKEIEENTLKVEYKNGYNLEIDLASPYFLKGESSIFYDKSYVLIINDLLSDLEKLSLILNEIIKQKQNLIIIANDFDEYFINEIASLNFDEKLNCCLFKISEYGNRQRIVKEDLEIITGAKIVEDENKITFDNLGIINGVSIDNKNALFSFNKNIELNNYINKIRSEEKKITDEFDKSFYQKRVAMFTTGLAEILIGAQTKTECREKKMRLEDALCALESAKKGVLPGGGLALLKIGNKMQDENFSDKIFKEALRVPFEQILTNSGINPEKILKEIEKNDYNILFNVSNNQYEDIKNTSVIDSLSVTINSLQNACSIATMLLTTTSLIINEYKEINKVNNYDEI